MAVTVSFTGSPAEILELFRDNRFLEVIREQVKSQERPAEETPVEETSVEVKKEPDIPAPPERKISRQQMLHAVQEYAVRMHNRYKERNPELDVKDMCAQLLLEITAGTAMHTSMVREMFIEAVTDAAVNDCIPSSYVYLTRS